MHFETIVATNDLEAEFAQSALPDASVLFYFLSPDYPQAENYMKMLKSKYPGVPLVGCSTSGEIADNKVLINTAVSTAIKFNHTRLKVVQADVGGMVESYEAGVSLGQQLNAPDLKFIFVLSDGLKVNGNELIGGIVDNTGKDVILTGGFAGDGVAFKKTAVGVDGLPETGKIAAVGFYGDKFRVSYGSAGGWKKFGPMRVITRSEGNVLYELDGQNALGLYKKYLGAEAANLPASGQYFPLTVSPDYKKEHEVVRAFLGIDEGEESLLFAGDVPQGYHAQLMHGSTNNLVEGATQAAIFALNSMKGLAENNNRDKNVLALVVSCIGRNMMMKQRTSNEVEAIDDVLGGVPMVGFYSYGEICHHSQTGVCDFHNQTMTITLISEDD